MSTTRPIHWLIIGALACSAITLPAQAEPPDPAAREKARPCTTCHGLDGLRRGGEMPAIGGLDYFHLLYNMARFKEGDRFHPVMSLLMQTLDAADMADVADYFAAMDRTPLERIGPYGVP
ncbi:MAG: hypothetical protein AB1899_09100 [Pseudomonadota bacterium]